MDAISVNSHTDDPLDSNCCEDELGDSTYSEGDVYDNLDEDRYDDLDDDEVIDDEWYEDDYEETEDW